MVEMVLREQRRGRPERLSEQQKNAVVRLYNAGDTQRSIADKFGVSLSTVKRIIAERRL
jgi:DNA invertase Pin-like site-specific DNA recombinase